MMAEYPIFTLCLIYSGLYYFSIKKVVINKNFTKMDKSILIAIVVLIPIIGVFVPLFILADKNNHDVEIDYSTTNEDKLEVFHQSINHSQDGTDFD